MSDRNVKLGVAMLGRAFNQNSLQQMADVVAGLESDLEEVKTLMRSSSAAYASAAKALVRLRSSRDGYISLVSSSPLRFVRVCFILVPVRNLGPSRCICIDS
jgi:hypothetical protein